MAMLGAFLLADSRASRRGLVSFQLQPQISYKQANTDNKYGC
jgi:hypothetical protein